MRTQFARAFEVSNFLQGSTKYLRHSNERIIQKTLMWNFASKNGSVSPVKKSNYSLTHLDQARYSSQSVSIRRA
ncbi:hypothetical protein C4J91_3579 [Pseudomonas sp. R3-52-08]|nr:hypothetical protein C4J91_3579 [Pseudomonas sp. R3-52-08]